MKIILASKSPQREKILELLGLKFEIINPEIDESVLTNDINPSTYTKTLSALKAKSISKTNPDALVIGADTIIFFNNKIIGKPNNLKEAFKQLKSFSGKTHYVYTGVSLINKSFNESIIEKTKVTFDDLSDKDILYYLENYPILERAGSYGIQEWSSVFIKKIDGCYYNVVGFPLSKFYKLLNKFYTKYDRKQR